jgi:hypothetical protein
VAHLLALFHAGTGLLLEVAAAQAFEQAGEVVVAGESCEVDPATGKRGC